jgi:hypothetical protein
LIVQLLVADMGKNDHKVTRSAVNRRAAMYQRTRVKNKLTKVQSYHSTGVWKGSANVHNKKSGQVSERMVYCGNQQSTSSGKTK